MHCLRYTVCRPWVTAWVHGCGVVVQGTKFGSFELDFADDFEYVDPIDGSKASKQGLRFVFTGEGRGRAGGWGCCVLSFKSCTQ
jgi:hypothetical protein